MEYSERQGKIAQKNNIQKTEKGSQEIDQAKYL